jgi:hypothetical protein
MMPNIGNDENDYWGNLNELSGTGNPFPGNQLGGAFRGNEDDYQYRHLSRNTFGISKSRRPIP